MNRHEQRAGQQRRAALRFSMMIGTAGLALVVVVLLILGLSSSAPPRYFTDTVIGLAILLLILRQVSRRLKTKGSRAAQPDPRSTLKLN